MRALLILAWLLPAAAALAEEPPPPGPARASDADEPPAARDCDGRNPFYCGVVVEQQDPEQEAGAKAGETLLRPPGGCEGRNPLYCEELEPPAEAEPEERRRKRFRNPKRPRRNPAGRS